jgi:DNA-binding NarL/FixJ family response regulator
MASTIRPEEPVPVPDELTDREREVAALLVQGLRNREIAQRLYLSPETIKDYVHKILRKLGARNRVEATKILLHREPDAGAATG